MSSNLVVLCNAGPLITLGKLNRLELLVELYGEVQIPYPVYDEVVTSGLAKGASDAVTVRLFWQRQKWPMVDVPQAVLDSYTPSVKPATPRYIRYSCSSLSRADTDFSPNRIVNPGNFYET